MSSSTCCRTGQWIPGTISCLPFISHMMVYFLYGRLATEQGVFTRLFEWQLASDACIFIFRNSLYCRFRLMTLCFQVPHFPSNLGCASALGIRRYASLKYFMQWWSINIWTLGYWTRGFHTPFWRHFATDAYYLFSERLAYFSYFQFWFVVL